MLLFIWKNVLEAGSMVHSCKNVLKVYVTFIWKNVLEVGDAFVYSVNCLFSLENS